MKKGFLSKRVCALAFAGGIIFCFLAHVLWYLERAGEAAFITFLNFDLYTYFLPFFTFARESALAGKLPLWSPYGALGRPFLGINVYGMFYPANWILLVTDAPFALLVNQCGAIAVGMAGTVLFLRYLKLNWLAVTVGAVLVGYSIFPETYAPNIGSTLCWFPLLLWLTHRLFDKPGLGAGAVLAISLTVCFFGGSVQFFYYILILLVIYFSIMSLFAREKLGLKGILVRFGTLGAACGVTAGLVSVQLLPSIELSLSSIRNFTAQVGLVRNDIITGSFSLKHVFQNYMNRTSSWYLASFPRTPFSLYYFGTALLFLPFGFKSIRNRRIFIALLVTLACMLLFIESKQVPALRWFGLLPFANTFRWHMRLLALCNLVVAFMAAIGFSSLGETEPLGLRSSRTLRFSWFWLLVLLFLIGVPFGIFTVSDQLSYSALLVIVLAPCLIMGFLTFPRGPARSWPSWKGWILALLVVIDLGTAKHILSAVPAMTDSAHQPVEPRVQWIKRNAGYDRALLLSERRTIRNAGSMYGVFDINSYDCLTPSRWNNYVRALTGAREYDKVISGTFNKLFYGEMEDFEELIPDLARMLGVASVRYFLTYEPIEEDGVAHGAPAWKLVFRSEAGPQFFVYENRYALPRAYLVDEYVVTHTEEESLAAVTRNLSGLSRMAVIEGGSPSFPPSTGSASPGPAEIESYRLNEVALTVEARTPSLLILTDHYYPGWSVYVDGAEKPIWRANSVFRAVEAPPGRHTIIFRYRPDSLRIGAIVALVTGTITVAATVMERHYTRAK